MHAMEQDFAKRRLRTPLAEPAPVSQPSSLGLLLTGLITGVVIGLFIALLVYLSGALPAAPGHTEIAETRPVETLDIAPAGGLTPEQQREAQRLQLEFYQELPNYEVVVDVTPVAGAVPRTPVTTTASPAATDNTTTASEPVTTAQTSTAPAQVATTQPAPAQPLPTQSEQLDPVSAALLEISNREARAQAQAPTAAAASTNIGNFLLQAGAFQQQATAAAQLNRLLSLGLNARIREENLPGRTLYLVQAGPYSTRDDMMQAERVLRNNSIDSMRITLSQP
jgi:cell division protein FtsN